MAAAAQWAQEEPKIEQNTGPAWGELHIESRVAAMSESGLQDSRLITTVGNEVSRKYNFHSGLTAITTVSLIQMINVKIC